MFVWTISDAGALTFGVLVLAVAVYVFLLTWLRQAWCKHDLGVNETRACDAICRGCGKNLGFIGDWRGRQRR